MQKLIAKMLLAVAGDVQLTRGGSLVAQTLHLGTVATEHILYNFIA